MHFDRILTESGFWATNFETLPAEGLKAFACRERDAPKWPH
jgi:hypothetical protein